MNHPAPPSRRAVLGGGLAALAAAVAPACNGSEGETPSPSPSPSPVPTEPPTVARDIPEPIALVSLIGAIGELGEPDAIGARLPPGFTIRIVARSGEVPVAGSEYVWHPWPDGGATFATEDGGWIYVSNCELPFVGGVGALRFDASGALISATPILTDTNVNCAGGKTPWHTWLSCEEVDRGRVWECDPWGERAPVERPALGRFKHEAAAIDPVNAHVYLTEDEPDGRLYRFVPDALTPEGHPDLTAGRLEVARVEPDDSVVWETVPDPLAEGEVATRHQVESATVFRGGEGVWWHAGTVYVSTKGDDRVWAYDTATSRITTIYDRATADDPTALRGVDNLTVSCCGDVLVAEDGGSMQIVAILPDGTLKPLVQLLGQDNSEVCGPAFDPSGTRLYFSSQRAEGVVVGLTYEITGPFHAPA